MVTPTSTTTSLFHVLTSRNFRLLWLSQAISTFGDKFTAIAIPALIYNLTDSVFTLGVALIIQTLATMLFGFVAGTMTDRWDRRRTMIVTNVLRALVILAIPSILSLFGNSPATLFLLYACSFLVASITQFFVPAKIALIPDTVNESELVAANSFDQSTTTIMEFFGYGAAGFVVDRLSNASAFWVDGTTFIVAAVIVMLMKTSYQRDGDVKGMQSVKSDIVAGFNYIRQVPLLKEVTRFIVFAPLAVGAIIPLMLPFSRDILKTGISGFGILEAVFAVGFTTGAIYVNRRVIQPSARGRILTRSLIWMGVGQGLTIIVPITLHNVLGVRVGTPLLMIALPFYFLTAVSNAPLNINFSTIIQENSPREMIGRVYSTISVVRSVAIALGAGLSIFADERFLGVNLSIIFWSVFMIVTGFIFSRSKIFRNLET